MSNKAVMTVVLWLATSSTAAAQRPWVEARGPNVTVVTDAGAGRARDLVWQFEQVREAMSRIFPWVRLRWSKPLVVLGARNEATMRVLTPGDFERTNGRGFASVGSEGRERSYIALRADLTNEDREGVNPYEHAYWSFSARALGETSEALPLWLRRGMASVVANTLVRDQEIQLGRVIERHLAYLRSRPRLPLSEVVSLTDGRDSRVRQEAFLAAHDAHAWAFVHFLVWANRGEYQQGLDAYIKGVLGGADPIKSLASTLGDVSRLENAFDTYVSRDIFPFTKFQTEAKLRREAFPVRDVPAVEMAILRASAHVAMDRPGDARAVVADAQRLQAGVGDEVLGLIAEFEGRNDDMHQAFERAIDQPYTSWYAPYRLATLLSPTGQSGYRRVRLLLELATTKNPEADDAWAYLAVALSELDEREGALAAITRALEMRPASSDHRRFAARAYLRLGMLSEAQRAAGLARAYARTPQEAGMSQDMLALVARGLAATAGQSGTSADDPATAGLDAPAGAAGGGTVASGLAPASVARGAEGASIPVAPADGTGVRAIGVVINDCYMDPGTCRAALPIIERDCRNLSSVTSAAACRSAGYILDAGIGVPAMPARAADLYGAGCDRNDQLSCVRLATLRSRGRGVPRDGAAALAVLEPACAGGLQEACYRLGLHLAATGVAADRARARDVLNASCKADFTESCAALKTLTPQ